MPSDATEDTADKFNMSVAKTRGLYSTTPTNSYRLFAAMTAAAAAIDFRKAAINTGCGGNVATFFGP